MIPSYLIRLNVTDKNILTKWKDKMCSRLFSHIWKYLFNTVVSEHMVRQSMYADIENSKTPIHGDIFIAFLNCLPVWTSFLLGMSRSNFP